MAKSVAHNTAFMTAASVAQKVISFAYFTIIARHFAAESVGKYTTALAFTTIFAVLIDLGLTNVFIRDGAKEPSHVQTLLSRVLGLKMMLAVVVYIVMIVVARLSPSYDETTRLLIAISGVTVIFDSVQVTLYGALRVYGQLAYEAIGLILAQTLTFVSGGLFLMAHLPIVYLMAAFLMTSLIHVVYVVIVAAVRYHIYSRPRWPGSEARPLMLAAIPFALAAVCFRIFTATDSLMVFSVVGAEAAGWYSIPTKITSAFQFVPLSLVAAVYPRMSEWSVTNPERQRAAVVQSLQYLFAIVLPIAVGIMALARYIIPHFFTAAYAPAIVPLQCLMIGMIFSFLMYPIGASLNAMGRQHIHTAFVAAVTVLNIFSTAIFVRLYGIVGAAGASLASTALLTIAEYYYLSRLIVLPHKYILTWSIKVLVAAFIMGGVVVWSTHFLPWIVTPFIGAGVYALCVVVFGAVTREQLKSIRAKFFAV